jgi:hypothetical protein
MGVAMLQSACLKHLGGPSRMNAADISLCRKMQAVASGHPTRKSGRQTWPNSIACSLGGKTRHCFWAFVFVFRSGLCIFFISLEERVCHQTTASSPSPPV